MIIEISMFEVTIWQTNTQETELCILRYQCLRLQSGKIIAKETELCIMRYQCLRFLFGK